MEQTQPDIITKITNSVIQERKEYQKRKEENMNYDIVKEHRELSFHVVCLPMCNKYK